MSFAVCVTFEIKPDAMDEFMELMIANAKTSLELEDACIQFDVCQDESQPTEVFLYELYESQEAFGDHLKSQHFQTFDLAVAPMILEKQVKTYRTVR